MAVRCGTKAIAVAIAGIDETEWQTIDYTPGGQAQAAESEYMTGTGRQRVTRRLIVRRTRLTDIAQQRLFPDWRHHAFLTDLTATPSRSTGSTATTPSSSSPSATSKKAPGSNTSRPGTSTPTPWLQTPVLAHNLICWTAHLGNVRVDDELTVARTMRTRLVAIPGRLVNRAGRTILRLPTRWPWADTFTIALNTLRLLRPAPA
jgi:hypothetical protein